MSLFCWPHLYHLQTFMPACLLTQLILWFNTYMLQHSCLRVHFFGTHLSQLLARGDGPWIQWGQTPSICHQRALRSQIYKGFPNQAISRCYPGFCCYCVCLDQLLRFGNGITPYLQLQIVLCQDGVSLRHSAIDGQNAAPGNDTNIGQFITYTE